MSVENSGDLSPSAQRNLAAIAATPTITIVQLAHKLGVNRRTVERNIKILREKGRLVRAGARTSVYSGSRLGVGVAPASNLSRSHSP
ncbi:HTH domain-containing protein [Brenneria corticis]|nr:HTH domain-containing protein [Brenneria sp. CFCC 11842]